MLIGSLVQLGNWRSGAQGCELHVVTCLMSCVLWTHCPSTLLYRVLEGRVLTLCFAATCCNVISLCLPSQRQVVHKAALLPALRDGDWLMFPFAGAYTICAASNYGGVRFTQPLKLFIYSGSVHRETEGFDMAAGVAAAAAAVWHNNPSNTSCCGSEGGAVVSGGAAVSVSVDSDSSSNSGDSVGAGGSGSPHSVGLADGAAGKCSGADDGGVVCCLLCGGGGCGLVSGGEGEEDCATPKGFSGSCVCGGGLGADGGAVDDGCMSVASDGTAATVLVGMEGCADSLLLQEPDITSMIIV